MPAADTASAAKQATKKSRPGGTLYRGNEGMWSWVLHRITGVAIFFFLLVHVLDTALVRVSPEAYNAVMHTYKTPIMGLGEAASSARSCSTHTTASVSSWSTTGARALSISDRCSGS